MGCGRGQGGLDVSDDDQITEPGIVAARFAYLSPRPVAALLSEMTGHDVRLPGTSDACRQLLMTRRGATRPAAPAISPGLSWALPGQLPGPLAIVWCRTRLR